MDPADVNEPSGDAEAARTQALADLEAARGEREEGNDDPALDFRIALLLHGMGRFDESERAFQACEMNSLREGGGNYLEAALLGRAECLRLLDRFDEAREVLSRVPESAQLWLGSLVSPQSLRAALSAR